MTQVVNPYQTSALPPHDPLNRKTTDLVEDISMQALTKGVNLGQLIVNAYLFVEEASKNKSHLKIDELEAHEKRLKTVTKFLSEIEKQLANPQIKEINLTHDHTLVEEMYNISEIELLNRRSTWSREEAEAIKTGLTRHSQIFMQKVHHLSSDVNRTIEEGTELLQIARKLLDMLDRLHQTFTSNQKTK